MKRRIRIRYTESQKAVMWDRWQQGESLHQIARAVVTAEARRLASSALATRSRMPISYDASAARIGWHDHRHTARRVVADVFVAADETQTR